MHTFNYISKFLHTFISLSILQMKENFLLKKKRNVDAISSSILASAKSLLSSHIEFIIIINL